MLLPSNNRIALACLVALLSLPALGANLPPANPFLADSHRPLGHGSSAQQGSVPIAGLVNSSSRRLTEHEIEYLPVGPGFLAGNLSGSFADGGRVYWANGLDRIVKIDHDSFEVLASHHLPDTERFTEEDAERSLARLNRHNSGLRGVVNAFRDAPKLGTVGVYTLIDRDNVFYVGSPQGTITAYGSADPEDRHSDIVVLREFDLPAEVTGLMIGINMTYDGWILVSTEHGYLVAISRDFERHHVTRLRHSEGAEDKATGPRGRGWVRTSLTVDDEGGVYTLSQNHLHKVMWTGDGFSLAEADGAWSEPYLNSHGHGSGSTPTLMGFGEEDRFVVFTDGEHQMNLMLYWRDEIPEGWRPPDGAPSRRVAGMLPITMGDPELEAIQSEQSVVVGGYGALVVNNVPRNPPWYVPRQAHMMLVGFLGASPRHQPYGVQKLAWNPERRQLEYAWANRAVSSPNCVPLLSIPSRTVYLVGARDNEWTLEALDWDSGKERFHWFIGDERYNSMYSGTKIDREGRIHYGTHWGRVRLNPEDVR